MRRKLTFFTITFGATVGALYGIRHGSHPDQLIRNTPFLVAREPAATAPRNLSSSPERLMYKLQPSPVAARTQSASSILQAIQSAVDPGATSELLLPNSSTYLIKLSSSALVPAALTIVRAQPGVLYAEADQFQYANFGRWFRRKKPSPTPPYSPTPSPSPSRSPSPSPSPGNGGNPDDPRFSSQWHFAPVASGGSLYGADVLPLWQKNIIGSPTFTVAVIDTGVDLVHPDLAANIFVNSRENNGITGIDDDLNGYTDDKKGWNFVSGNNYSADDQGHGTHVAGIVAAAGDNAVGVVGAVWNSKILSLKTLNSDGQGYGSDGVRALDYAIRMGVKVINCSWGSYGYLQTMKEIIDVARTQGVLIVAAAGNESTDTDTTPHYPSGYDSDNVIAVAASTQLGGLASFSNFGRGSVDLAAPGSSIYSTLMGNQYGNLSGTSMAAPVVSGVAALLWSANATWNYATLRDRLLRCSKPLFTGGANVASGGTVNANNAYYSTGCR